VDITWQGSVDIAAPVDKVYAYLADFPKHCEWAQTLERMEQKKPGDPSGVGAVYKTYERQALHSDRVPRGPMPENASKGTTESEVTELVPNRSIRWKAHPLPIGMGVYAKLAFDLAPVDGNTTRLTQNVDFHMPTMIFKFFSRFVYKDSVDSMVSKQKAQYQASLNNIKTIMEEPDGV
jgi:uncharacterized membrane protein